MLHATLPGAAGESLIGDCRSAFSFDSESAQFNLGTAHMWQVESLYWICRLVLPAFALALTLGLAVNIGQVGFAVTPEALNFHWDRLNPINGFKRLFSLRGTIELVKGIVKMLIVFGIVYTTVRDAILNDGLLNIMGSPLPIIMAAVGHVLWMIGLRVSVALLIIAIADYAFQKYDFEKNIKMSASEIKQEMKDTDGDPHTKARVRKIQREMSRKRMMQAVPKADVVVTNPTHFAVALAYESGSNAPKVVAKGQDFVAHQIKEVARENNVPIVENKPLAQELYRTVEIGGEIPGELYAAVAQVLAFVYRTYGRRPPVKTARRARRRAKV